MLSMNSLGMRGIPPAACVKEKDPRVEESEVQGDDPPLCLEGETPKGCRGVPACECLLNAPGRGSSTHRGGTGSGSIATGHWGPHEPPVLVPFVAPAPRGTHFSLWGLPKEKKNQSCRTLVFLSPLEQSSPSKLDLLLLCVAVREIKLFGVFVFMAQG